MRGPHADAVDGGVGGDGESGSHGGDERGAVGDVQAAAQGEGGHAGRDDEDPGEFDRGRPFVHEDHRQDRHHQR